MIPSCHNQRRLTRTFPFPFAIQGGKKGEFWSVSFDLQFLFSKKEIYQEANLLLVAIKGDSLP